MGKYLSYVNVRHVYSKLGAQETTPGVSILIKSYIHYYKLNIGVYGYNTLPCSDVGLLMIVIDVDVLVRHYCCPHALEPRLREYFGQHICDHLG